MEKKKNLFLRRAVVIAATTPLVITDVIYRRNFRVREKPPTGFREYFMAENPDLKAEDFSCLSDKGDLLRGIQLAARTGQPKGLIVLTHGYHRSIENYFPEAAAFARAGYMVIMFDGTGVGSSEGKGILGLPQHVLDMKTVLDRIEEDPELSRLPLLLYGHSWGGYAADTVFCLKQYNVRGIISVAAFNDPNEIARPSIVRRIGVLHTAVIPVFNSMMQLKYGKLNRYTSAEGLARTDCPVLAVHSRDDSIVDYTESYLKICKALEGHKGFEHWLLTGRNHNVVTPPDIDQRERELYRKFDEQGYIMKEEEMELWQLLSRKDDEMIAKFVDFYDRCLE